MIRLIEQEYGLEHSDFGRVLAAPTIDARQELRDPEVSRGTIAEELRIDDAEPGATGDFARNATE